MDCPCIHKTLAYNENEKKKTVEYQLACSYQDILFQNQADTQHIVITEPKENEPEETVEEEENGEGDRDDPATADRVNDRQKIFETLGLNGDDLVTILRQMIAARTFSSVGSLAATPGKLPDRAPAAENHRSENDSAAAATDDSSATSIRESQLL